MWRGISSLLRGGSRYNNARVTRQARYLSSLGEEEQRLLSSPREGMDYDVLLVCILFLSRRLVTQSSI
jgi:hypothetical protein